MYLCTRPHWRSVDQLAGVNVLQAGPMAPLGTDTGGTTCAGVMLKQKPNMALESEQHPTGAYTFKSVSDVYQGSVRPAGARTHVYLCW